MTDRGIAYGCSLAFWLSVSVYALVCVVVWIVMRWM
jgi:hypothetical protein